MCRWWKFVNFDIKYCMLYTSINVNLSNLSFRIITKKVIVSTYLTWNLNMHSFITIQQWIDSNICLQPWWDFKEMLISFTFCGCEWNNILVFCNCYMVIMWINHVTNVSSFSYIPAVFYYSEHMLSPPQTHTFNFTFPSLL